MADRILLLLFSLVRTACFAQGLALLTALFASPLVDASTASAWVLAIYRGSIQVGATFVATGIALVAAKRWVSLPLPEAAARQAVWPGALGLSLVLLPAFVLLRSGDLVALWQLVSGLLDQVGFREEFARGGQGSGLVMLPILVAMLVPILETLEAFFLVVVPVLMLAPLLLRSALFPRLFAMLVAVQAGLAIASLLSAATLSSVLGEAMSSLQAAGETELLHEAEIAAQLRGLLQQTAQGFVLPAAGYALWLPFLLMSPRLGAWFRGGSVPAASHPAP